MDLHRGDETQCAEHQQHGGYSEDGRDPFREQSAGDPTSGSRRGDLTKPSFCRAWIKLLGHDQPESRREDWREAGHVQVDESCRQRGGEPHHHPFASERGGAYAKRCGNSIGRRQLPERPAADHDDQDREAGRRKNDLGKGANTERRKVERVTCCRAGNKLRGENAGTQHRCDRWRSRLPQKVWFTHRIARR